MVEPRFLKSADSMRAKRVGLVPIVRVHVQQILIAIVPRGRGAVKRRVNVLPANNLVKLVQARANAAVVIVSMACVVRARVPGAAILAIRPIPEVLSPEVVLPLRRGLIVSKLGVNHPRIPMSFSPLETDLEPHAKDAMTGTRGSLTRFETFP